MSERVRETDLKALIKSFFGIDEEDYEQDNLSAEDAIKKCKEITEQQKGDLLKAVENSSKLEAILDYSQKSKGKSSRKKQLFSKSEQAENEKLPEIRNKAKGTKQDEIDADLTK